MNAVMNSAQLSRSEILHNLRSSSPKALKDLRDRSYAVMAEACGEDVYYRGLLEFSNSCARDCLYCGIRRSNAEAERYRLSPAEAVVVARWVADSGYGSITLQGGERKDRDYLEYVETLLREIKTATRSSVLPEGLGITLCIGEQSRETYLRLLDAGAHRYLLRIETSNPVLYGRIHPASDSFEERVRCLENLKETGYQLGSGVMVGIPEQTEEDLAADLEFLRDMNVDMIGMGPYIPHSRTPMGAEINQRLWPAEKRLGLTLKMISLMRLIRPRANIAATTALQTIHPLGRELGLGHGANVLMPLVTPEGVSKSYQLYDGKPCLDDNSDDCRDCLLTRVQSTRRQVAFNVWGDPRHFFDRTEHPAAPEAADKGEQS